MLATTPTTSGEALMDTVVSRQVSRSNVCLLGLSMKRLVMAAIALRRSRTHDARAGGDGVVCIRWDPPSMAFCDFGYPLSRNICAMPQRNVRACPHPPLQPYDVSASATSALWRATFLPKSHFLDGSRSKRGYCI